MSRDRGRGVGTPQIVCLLETKNGEEEVDDVRASGWGVEWCLLNGSWVWYSEI